ncbi:MAG: hypothetical protein EXX96DRAFT_589242 [Benjaminiella poitrasii]|nr:MAG: hypothetical protein EXX96DRAFT_589242 [Benjaminiella poitrasii]
MMEQIIELKPFAFYNIQLNFWSNRLKWVLQCISHNHIPNEIISVILESLHINKSLLAFLCQITTYDDMKILDFIICEVKMTTWNRVCNTFRIAIAWTDANNQERFILKSDTTEHLAIIPTEEQFLSDKIVYYQLLFDFSVHINTTTLDAFYIAGQEEWEDLEAIGEEGPDPVKIQGCLSLFKIWFDSTIENINQTLSLSEFLYYICIYR